ncbi:MAG TPA: C13 family peptidase [Reyranella sp.]|nr:C13 family peptidase [Reyranella sp.]
MHARITAAALIVLSLVSCAPPSDSVMAVVPPGPVNAPAVTRPVSVVPPAGWHAVLVAGDNSSPAFDNGIETLRDRLSTMGVRSIRSLSADPSHLRGSALSSSTNVRDAIAGEGGEACLAYITSHGEQRGFFLRPDRRIFTPASLDHALVAGCGAAPTVVVVSACHSGTFINEQTRRPNRIIMAAAAIDRTSFGCGANDDYTYYDQCLLQTIDTVATWRELALGTRACVERLERQLGIGPRDESRPQLFIGEAVANLRLPGR